MSNISFHGTSVAYAKIIVGPPSNVNVNIGKGELGKGFYTGSSIALAAIWAQTRFADDAVVVKFDIPEPRFVQLKGKVFKTKADVASKWNELKTSKETDSYISDHDYIIAPFVSMDDMGHQLKFESIRAQDELNAAQKQIFPCAS